MYSLITWVIKAIRHTITSVAEDVEKLEHSYFTARSINGTATLENNLAVPQKVKHRVTISSVQFIRSVMSDSL